MTLLHRSMRFYAVSAGGVLVHAAALAALVPLMSAHYLAATVFAVEAAVLHNFFWHRRWTWKDRPGATASLLLRFNLTTGLCSILANVVVMRLLVGEAGLHPLAAGLAAILASSVANFLLSDRFVFVSR